MRLRFAIALFACLFGATQARADSTVSALATTTSALSLGLLYFDQGPGTDTKLGIDATLFGLSAGKLTIPAGNITSSLLANTGVSAATYGSATQSMSCAINAQGQATSCSNVTITPAIGSVTGLGTSVATALGNALNGASGPIGALTPTLNNCPVGNGTTWVSAACPGGSSGITFTDGTHTVSGSTQLTVTGGTVGGTTPNATLTITGTSNGVGVQGGQSVSNIGDNATALPNGHYVYATNVNMTAARSHNLPDSATQGVGDINVIDAQQTVTNTNTLTVAAAGTDKLNGVTNGTAVITAAGGGLNLHNDGAGNWTSGWFSNSPALTNAQIWVGKTGGSVQAVTMSQDCTITNAGVMTCLKTNNVSFGTAATGNTGTSGGTIPLLNGTNTWSGTQTFGTTMGTVTTQSGTTYTLASTDCGTAVRFTNASAVTVTIPATLAAGCNIAIEQAAAGQVSVNGSAVSAATLHSAHSYTKTFGQWAILGIFIESNGGTAVAIVTGDGA